MDKYTRAVVNYLETHEGVTNVEFETREGCANTMLLNWESRNSPYKCAGLMWTGSCPCSLRRPLTPPRPVPQTSRGVQIVHADHRRFQPSVRPPSLSLHLVVGAPALLRIGADAPSSLPPSPDSWDITYGNTPHPLGRMSLNRLREVVRLSLSACAHDDDDEDETFCIYPKCAHLAASPLRRAAYLPACLAGTAGSGGKGFRGSRARLSAPAHVDPDAFPLVSRAPRPPAQDARRRPRRRL